MTTYITIGTDPNNCDFVTDGIADEIEINAAAELASVVEGSVCIKSNYPPKVVEMIKKVAEKRGIIVKFKAEKILTS